MSPQVNALVALALGVGHADRQHLAAGQLDAVDGEAPKYDSSWMVPATPLNSSAAGLVALQRAIFSGRSATVTGMPSVPVMPWPT